MSLLLSGDDLASRSFRFGVQESSQVGEVRRFANQLAQFAEFSATRQGAVGVVVNELGTNLFKHGKNGEFILRAIEFEAGLGIEVLAIDSGPGIRDIPRSFEDGFSSAGTPGTGLGAILRQSDLCDIESSEKGTIVLAGFGPEKDPSAIKSSNSLYVGAISIPYPGETVCGDSWIRRQFDSSLLLMVADGLGHGVFANAAANEAVAAIKRTSSSSSLDMMLEEIHLALRSTRGAAATVVRISVNQGTLEHAALGNVRSMVFDGMTEKTLLNHAGTLGFQYKSRPTVSVAWSNRSRLVMHSDGLTTKTSLIATPGLSAKHPAIIAASLFRDFNRGRDDSTVIVVGAP